MYNVQRRLFSLLFVLLSMTLSAENYSADSVMLEAYRHEDMSVWKNYIDSFSDGRSPTANSLLYEYGYCGYIVSEDKEAAKPYVRQYQRHVEALRDRLPAGYYEMYMSSVYVYELRLHESVHPLKAMSLAKEATRLAPDDPAVLSYYGTCLFYAPKPFGSKADALVWFSKAEPLFRDSRWQFCWLREANSMYIHQCREKLDKGHSN